MTPPETYVAFGAVMLLIALLAVAIDWFGKPLRHRKFVPKMYRYPDERRARRAPDRPTPWSDAALVLPVTEGLTLDRGAASDVEPADPRFDDTPVEAADDMADGHHDGPRPSPYPDGAGPALSPTASRPSPYPDGAGPSRTEDTAPEPEVADDPLESPVDSEDVDIEDVDHQTEDHDEIGEIDEIEPSLSPDETSEPIEHEDAEPSTPAEPGRNTDSSAWRPGDDVFAPDEHGAPAPPNEIRTRYWRNVGDTAGATLFGARNVTRMVDGQPPQRRNARTGRMESMRLPVGSSSADGETPIPHWPSHELDPFAN